MYAGNFTMLFYCFQIYLFFFNFSKINLIKEYHRVRSVSPILFEVGIQIWCMDASLDGDMLSTIFGLL